MAVGSCRFLGRIALSLVGVAWTLVTYFVVPMIVIERKGAWEAVGDSKDLLRKTWGQQIASAIGFGLIGFLLALPGIVLLVVAVFAIFGSRDWQQWGLPAWWRCSISSRSAS